MKRGVKAALSGVVTVCLTAGLLWYLTGLVERKDSYEKYAEFYEQEEDFDVLFFGSSHMVNGVYPMELWKDYGIVSYNFGSHNMGVPVSYWILKNALQYATPKLVLIDCYTMSATWKANVDLSHVPWDYSPISPTKVSAVSDLFEGREEEYLWDFCLYHDRWSELTEEDFVPSVSTEKGGEIRVGSVQVPVNEFVPEDERPVPEEEPVATTYLRKAIELCQSKGIQVVLVYIPLDLDVAWQAEPERVEELAAEYGIGAVNFFETDDVVDFDVDFSDIGHLNSSGARKVTDYLGRYITENYDIPDRRDDPAYAGWNEDYAAYTNYKLELLAGQTELKSYLALLQDKNLSACVYLADDSLLRTDAAYRELLMNVGIDPDALPDGPCLAVVDRAGGKTSYLRPGESMDASFGEAAFARTDEAYGVQVNGQEALSLRSDAVAGVVAVDIATSQTAAPAQFASNRRETKIIG